jgi:hypothetical protein
MYPLTCHAGFNVPARAGKFDIVGFTVVGDDTLSDASTVETVVEFAIIDDPDIDQSGKAGKLIASLEVPTLQKNILVHKKIQYVADVDSASGQQVYDATIEWFPPEPIKTRYGTSLYFNNIKQGSLCLYVR